MPKQAETTPLLHLDKGPDSATRHFSKAASYYDRNAIAQQRIANELAAIICRNSLQPKHILEIGCGTGFLTALLARHFPSSQITAIDRAERPLQLARIAVPGVEFIPLNFEQYRPDSEFDLIVSSSALQWIAPLEATMARIRQLLSPGGRFSAAIISSGTFNELHTSRATAVQAKPARRQLPSREEIIGCVSKAGFQQINDEFRRYVITFPDACAMLESARALGFTGGDLSTGQAALTRSELRAVCHVYQQNFGVETAAYLEACEGAELLSAPESIPNSRVRRILRQSTSVPVFAMTAAAFVSGLAPER